MSAEPNTPDQPSGTSLPERKPVRLLVILAITVAVFWLVFRKVNAGKTLDALMGSDPGLVALAILVSLVANTLIGADKWRRILHGMGCWLSFREALFIRLGCAPIRFTFPAKSGELFKAIYVQQNQGLPFLRGASSLVVDKLLNMWGMLFFLFVGIPFLGEKVPMSAVVLPVLFVVLPMLLWMLRRHVYAVLGKLHGRVRSLAEQLLSAFEEMSTARKIGLFAYSVLFQVSELVTSYILAYAVGIEPSVEFRHMFIIVPIVVVLASAPWAISGIGVREPSIAGLFYFYGYGPLEKSMAVGILVSAVEYVCPILVGLPFMPLFLKKIDIAWRKPNEAPL